MTEFEVHTPVEMVDDAQLIVANEDKTVRSIGHVIKSVPDIMRAGGYKTTVRLDDIPKGLMIPAELPAVMVMWIVRNHVAIGSIAKTTWMELFLKIEKNEEFNFMDMLKNMNPDQMIAEMQSQSEQLAHSNDAHDEMIKELQTISLDLLKSCIPLLRAFINGN